MAVHPLRLKLTMPPGQTHEQRLAAAQEIVETTLQELGDALAIGIYGSTAAGSDGPYSDLDMTIITGDDQSERSRCFSRHGLLVNLDYQTLPESEAEARDPAQAGNWLEFLVLYDPADTVGALRRMAAALTPDNYQQAFRKIKEGDLAAELGKIRNAAHTGDRAALHAALPRYGVAACRALGFVNGVSLTGEASLRAAAKGLPSLPPDFAALIDYIAGEEPAKEQARYDAAEALWEAIESIPEAVPG